MEKERLEKVLTPLIVQALEKGIFPGAAVGIQKGLGKGKRTYYGLFGKAAIFPEQRAVKKESVFDLASLTKPLATTLAILCLIKEEKISLDDPLASLLERKVARDKEEILLWQLLNHCSGLPAHKKYYQELKGFSPQQAQEEIVRRILEEDLAIPPGKEALYSDLGFILLGEVVRKKSGMDLGTYCRERIYAPLGVEKDVFFPPLMAAGEKRDFVATQHCLLRQRLLSGEVDDQNSGVMGGVSGHAGLFGTIKGVLTLTGHLLAQWHGKGEHPAFRNRDLEYFLHRHGRIGGSTWALGFDTPSREGSSAGRYISARSAGHLGFTGTSFWIDYQRELVMVLLTNRVHPRAENEAIRGFRPLFHDTVITFLG